MSIEVTDTTMTSDVTDHTAEWVPAAMDTEWFVSWLPQRGLDRNSAMTAMHLAETIASGDVSPQSPLIRTFAEELGVTAEYAVDAVKGVWHE